MILLYTPLNVSFNSVCKHFMEIFHLCLLRNLGYSFILFFNYLCMFLSGFGIRVTVFHLWGFCDLLIFSIYFNFLRILYTTTLFIPFLPQILSTAASPYSPILSQFMTINYYCNTHVYVYCTYAHAYTKYILMSPFSVAHMCMFLGKSIWD